MTHRRHVARATIRQVRAVRHTIRLAAAVGSLCDAAVLRILRSLPAEPGLHHRYPASDRVRAATAEFGVLAGRLVHAGLHAMAAWGHATAAGLVADHARDARRVVREATPYLIPPPTAGQLRSLVGPAPAALTTLAAANDASTVVLNGIAAGHDRKRIAAALEPVLQGVGSAARRVARTEGLRVATASQLAAAEQIPELVAGYQVLAVMDDRTRPAHRERSGTVYWRKPGPGQKGFAEMPRPPIEPDGRTSFNCRCTLAPVMATAGALSRVPDPDLMGEWWATADAADQELLVGPERYALAVTTLPEPPTWRDFIDPASDDLLSLELLKELWHAIAG